MNLINPRRADMLLSNANISPEIVHVLVNISRYLSNRRNAVLLKRRGSLPVRTTTFHVKDYVIPGLSKANFLYIIIFRTTSITNITIDNKHTGVCYRSPFASKLNRTHGFGHHVY